MKLQIQFNITRDWLVDFVAYVIAQSETPLPATKRKFLAAVRQELHAEGVEMVRFWRDYVAPQHHDAVYTMAAMHVDKLFPESV